MAGFSFENSEKHLAEKPVYIPVMYPEKLFTAWKIMLEIGSYFLIKKTFDAFIGIVW